MDYKDADIYFYLGNSLEKLKNYEDAIFNYRKAI